MFPSSRGHFREVACPQLSQTGKCSLLHCIFSHKAAVQPDSGPRSEKKRKVEDPAPAVGAARLKKAPLLMPAAVQNEPAQLPVRVSHLKIVSDRLQEQGEDDADKLAVELELEAAKRSTSFTYRGNIRNLVREITAGRHSRERQKELKEQAAQSRSTTLDNGLVELIIEPTQLTKRYIMEPPERDLEFDISVAPLECEKCGTGITVSGIEERLLDSENLGDVCSSHLLKRKWNPDLKRLNDTFPCCGEQLGESNGCQKKKSHVFKLTAPGQLARVIPFYKTPENPQALFAAGIDCEMAYTTLGTELVRVTVIDWATEKPVLDRLVYPFGKIIDLNTRFSGVSDIDAGVTDSGVHHPTLSFLEARNELFKYIGSRTILVGHGLENDLIALRLVHHRIVDTAMLYPRARRRTHALKELAWLYLSREIQTGEHDSAEDALAAMDVVRADISSRSALPPVGAAASLALPPV